MEVQDSPEEKVLGGLMHKQTYLDWAEVINAYRLIPRVLVAGVAWIVYITIQHFFGITMVPVTTCDAALIQVLIDNGKDLEAAERLACSVTDYVGGPTTQHVTFATAIVGGLATAVFGLYTNSGKKLGAD